jgi:hypothetical protein
MAEIPERVWPSYQVGPKDTVFALGVVSVNYARLEYAVLGMFQVILGLDNIVGPRLMFKQTNESRDKLMREMLPTWPWPENVHDLCWHFINANKICYENRNLLMHSNLVSGSEKAIVLYKPRRDGKLTLAQPTLKELHQVADDMHVLTWFAAALATMIRIEILKHPPHAGDIASWPGKPPLPIRLEYTEPPPPIVTRPPPAIR